MDPPIPEPFQPNRIFRIKAHQTTSRDIEIVDLSPFIPASQYTSDQIDDEAKAVVQREQPEPCLTVSKARFWTTEFVASSPTEPHIADVSFHHFSRTRITFASGSPHASHPLAIGPKHKFSRQQAFVLDSAPYRWAVRRQRRLILYKGGVQGAEVICAECRYESFGRNGATVLVDTSLINEVVALLTAVDAFRKAKQRNDD